MVRDLIRRDEAYAEASDILATRKFSPASNIRDPVVVAAVVAAGDEAARPPVQITAVGELATIDDKKASVSDVEDNGICFGVVRVLDELEGHDVIALKSSQVALYVSKQVRGVLAASAGLGLLIHFICEPSP